MQSTNEVTIKEIHRTMKLERLKEVVKLIQSGNNIHEHLDLIAGLPYEDYDSFGRSFDEIYELKAKPAAAGIFKRCSRARICLSMPRNMVLSTMISHRMR